MLKENAGKTYYKGLDSIRFFAAMMVFFSHAVYPVFQELGIRNDMMNRVIDAICSGMSGVSVFFVLSGFLITYLLFEEKKKDGTFSLKGFYIRRILRIWPLYYAVLLLVFFILPWLISFTGNYYDFSSRPWYYFAFIGNFDVLRLKESAHATTLLSQNITWSVAIEEQFYLFWPLLFLAANKRFQLPVIIATLVFSLSFRAFYQDRFFVVYLHTFSVLTDLATGALFAWLLQYHVRFRQFLSQRAAIVFWCGLLSAFVLMMYRSRIETIPYGYALGGLLYAVAFALVVVTQVADSKPGLHQLSRLKFASYWGKYTYGIYLIHPVILLLVKYFFEFLNIRSAGLPHLLLYAVVSLLLTFAASWLSFELFEKKFIRLKHLLAY